MDGLVADDRVALLEQLAASQLQAEQLERGLENRLVIGQAEGILMERLGIDAEQAIGYLRRTSNGLNRKLLDVAADIVETRELPQLP